VTGRGRSNLGLRWSAAGLAWGLWALTLPALAATAWLDHLLRQAGASELTWFRAAGVPYGVAAVSAATVGAVLASRRPAHPVGWLLLALGLSLNVTGVVYAYTRYGLLARPGALPAAGYLAGFSNGIVGVWLFCAGFALLLTPTGALPSPRWRWWARVAAAAAVLWLLAAILSPAPLSYPGQYPTVANPLALPGLSELLDIIVLPAGVVLVVALVVAAGSLVGRFRRARGVQRQQLRWLAFGAAVAAALLLVAVATLVLQGDTPLFQAAVGSCVALLPLATGAAILQYRLYDLDRIISRTLAYGLLTILLSLAYALVVVGLGRLLPHGSSLVVAGATLAVAAVFQPARRRVQAVVDRRFNRRRYDAAQLIEAFSARLRDEVDLDTLSGELLQMIEQTVQPTRASLWLRPQALSTTAARPASRRSPTLG
jgi:hypothetical protein